MKLLQWFPLGKEVGLMSGQGGGESDISRITTDNIRLKRKKYKYIITN